MCDRSTRGDTFKKESCKLILNSFFFLTRAYVHILKVYKASTVSICYPNMHTKFHLDRSTRGDTLKKESCKLSFCRENSYFFLTGAYVHVLNVYKASTVSICYPNMHTKFHLDRSTYARVKKKKLFSRQKLNLQDSFFEVSPLVLR